MTRVSPAEAIATEVETTASAVGVMEPTSAEAPAKPRVRMLREQRDGGQCGHSEQNHSRRFSLFELIHCDFSWAPINEVRIIPVGIFGSKSVAGSFRLKRQLEKTAAHCGCAGSLL